MCVQMIDTVTAPGAQPFGVQLKAMMDVEGRYQPKPSGLRLIESSQDNGLRMTSRLRELEVKDLLSLTRFFGFSSDTFSLAISLLDRFLSVMKVRKYTEIWILSSVSKINILWPDFISSPIDPTQAPVLCGPVLLLHRSEVLGRGEERAPGQRPDPHQSESLHRVWHDEDGEDHHGEALLEGEGPHGPPLSPPLSQLHPGAAGRWEVRTDGHINLRGPAVTQQDYSYSTKMCLFIFGFEENTRQKYFWGRRAQSCLKSWKPST